jgi:hypothetical protein
LSRALQRKTLFVIFWRVVEWRWARGGDRESREDLTVYTDKFPSPQKINRQTRLYDPENFAFDFNDLWATDA